MMFNNNGTYSFQGTPYNEAEVHRLSHTDNQQEDVIAQTMGIQSYNPLPQSTTPDQLRNKAQQDNNYQQPPRPQPQQFPPMQVHGRSLSISFAPDGTVTITIN